MNFNCVRLLIAFDIARGQVENPLANSASSAKSATVNFSKAFQNEFVKQVQQIRDCLQQHLDNIVDKDYVTSLATDLQDFQGKVNNNLGFTYDFEKQYSGLQKQRLSFQKNHPGSHKLLRLHKLTITVENTREFKQQLKASLANWIDMDFSEEEGEELHYLLEKDLVENSKSDFYSLARLMDTEALGKLQRSAKIKYLEYLLEHLGEHKDLIYLQDFIRRLKLLEEYINDVEQDDGHYEVNYAGIQLNYRDIFARANAFDYLPIIPQIAGYLGEIKDDSQLGKIQFIFGLKLKLNGPVQTEGSKSVLDYYLNLLDSNSKEHQEGLADDYRQQFFVEKVLKVAWLYFFVFAGNNPDAEGYTPESDLDYDPIFTFENYVLPVLQGSNDSDKQRRLRSIKKGIEQYNVRQKVERLKNLLLKVLRGKTGLKTRNYPLHISVKRGILERDYDTIYDNSTFFKSVLGANIKEALKYISVGDAAVDTNSLCTLTANIQISDMQYFSTEDSESFSMEYDLRGIRTIPVIVVPQDTQCRQIYQQSFQQQKLVIFSYNYQRLRQEIFPNRETVEAFVYQFTYGLLAYITLKVLLDASAKKLFMPILRLHLSSKDDPAPEEGFMRSIFYVISHLINSEHRCNCQGVDIQKINQYTIRNSLSSLYSILPKKFKFGYTAATPALDKLAIITVSSRESDRAKASDYKIANLLGEATGIYRESDDSIRLYSSGTFSDNYNSDEIYSRPHVLIDEVNKLYQQGYRHFLYIAKSPYTNTLNMTRTESDEELFFMSKAVISSLRGDREDIKIYPVFFDKYYVVKLQEPKVDSLYIQDTMELTSLVKDPHKKSVVFFNLFNGITVGRDRYYNGVISYATLLNIYEEILDDKDIYLGLIDDGSIKNDLLQYLTLFHVARYEAASRKISIKLDPYQNIIGPKSVGALSIFEHMTGLVKLFINALAFLTEVKKALNLSPESDLSSRTIMRNKPQRHREHREDKKRRG